MKLRYKIYQIDLGLNETKIQKNRNRPKTNIEKFFYIGLRSIQHYIKLSYKIYQIYFRLIEYKL